MTPTERFVNFLIQVKKADEKFVKARDYADLLQKQLETVPYPNTLMEAAAYSSLTWKFQAAVSLVTLASLTLKGHRMDWQELYLAAASKPDLPTRVRWWVLRTVRGLWVR